MTQIVDGDNVDDEEHQNEESITVTTNEMRQLLRAVRKYLQTTDIDNRVFDALVQVENEIDRASLMSLMSLIQKKITEFFK